MRWAPAICAPRAPSVFHVSPYAEASAVRARRAPLSLPRVSFAVAPLFAHVARRSVFHSVRGGLPSSASGAGQSSTRIRLRWAAICAPRAPVGLPRFSVCRGLRCSRASRPVSLPRVSVCGGRNSRAWRAGRSSTRIRLRSAPAIRALRAPVGLPRVSVCGGLCCSRASRAGQSSC